MSAFSQSAKNAKSTATSSPPALEPQPTWCPGCGDFGVLKALKGAAAELGLSPDEMMVTTGIGCSGKLNSYFNSYGFHTIHGRSLPIARAAKLANPGLTVVAAGGDGDGYGIGGNHFMHTARENHDITYIVFNNEIFGLTKGQTSPTSPMGHKSKTQPHGSAKTPLRPLSMSLNAGASYVARTAAVNPNQAKDIIVEAIEHDGFAHIDFLTQCPTWNRTRNTSPVHGRPAVRRVRVRRLGPRGSRRDDAKDRRATVRRRSAHRSDVHRRRAPLLRRGEAPERRNARGTARERYFDEDAEWERTYDTSSNATNKARCRTADTPRTWVSGSEDIFSCTEKISA